MGCGGENNNPHNSVSMRSENGQEVEARCVSPGEAAGDGRPGHEPAPGASAAITSPKPPGKT